MHELLLFAQIPSSRHTQLLNILAGVSAMQPVPILEKHLVFKPNRQPGHRKAVQVGAAQDVQKQVQAQTLGDVFYLQVVGVLDGWDGWSGTQKTQNGTGDNGGEQARGSETVRITKIAFPTMILGDGITWCLWYTGQFVGMARETSRRARIWAVVSHGLFFVHLSSPTDLDPLSICDDLSDTRPLDPSGAYTLEAGIQVQDGSKVEIMNKGMNEMLNIKETLKGVVELDVGDRLAMDTR
ncbi:MAG: hypothetical protein Q9163_006175, partial [Psora crenata]